MSRETIRESTDPYADLGLPQTATQAQIRSAFRKLARATHPDRNLADPAAEARFKRVARAWEVLGDPDRRAAYHELLDRGRFVRPGRAGPSSAPIDGRRVHSDLGHYSDFYRMGDPLTVAEAARLVGRNQDWLRRAIRTRRLVATLGRRGYLVRRRDVELLDRTARRRRPPA